MNKVLIIDDMLDESLPIMQSLSKRGVFTLYWDGKFQTKPDYPLEGVRLVFLDMRFSSVGDSRTIVTHLFTLLKDSISINNGPYILCVWSKHTNEYLQDFKEELPKQGHVPQPYLVTNIEKNQFIELISERNVVYDEIASALQDDNVIHIKEEVLQILQVQGLEENQRVQIKDDTSDTLIEHIDSKLKEMNSLATLLIWEELVTKSVKKLVNEISSLSEQGSQWDNNIKTLIQHLAKANAGKSLDETAKGYIVNAFSSLNNMLPDELWNQLTQVEIDEDEYKFIKDPTIKEIYGEDEFSISKSSKFVVKKNGRDFVAFKKVAELEEFEDKDICINLYNKYLKITGQSNFKLLCERVAPYEVNKPGSVYKVEDDELCSEICNSIFKNMNTINPSEISLIKLDISSACDYAQNKLKRVRILYGMLITSENFSHILETEDIYCTPDIMVEDKIVKMVFNFHYIFNETQSDMNSQVKFLCFRELLLSEIKQKLSSYISRVGLINL
jgi:hypothetical protein